MEKTESRSLGSSIIFPKGQKVASEYFIGRTWVETLVSNDKGEVEWMEPVSDEYYLRLKIEEEA